MREKSTAVQMDRATLKRLNDLARAKSKSREWVLRHAVKHFLDYENWFAREVNAGLRDVELGRMVDHEELVKKLERERADFMDAPRRARP